MENYGVKNKWIIFLFNENLREIIKSFKTRGCVGDILTKLVLQGRLNYFNEGLDFFTPKIDKNTA